MAHNQRSICITKSAMTQPDTQDILATMCAPALVCSAGGIVELMNQCAADRLGTTSAKAAGEPISAFLHAPDEMLFAFLQRTEANGHACSKGYVYMTDNQSRQTAMVCHAQRLQGYPASGNLLLILADVESDCLPDKSVSDRLSPSESFEPKLRNDQTAQWQPDHSGEHGFNALSNVALGLVHEVNQPLTAVSTYAHSCRRWISDDPAMHPKLLPTVDKIIEQVHITGEMINSLKGLVRGHDDERRIWELSELVRESLELLRLDPRLENCAVESHLDDKPCQVLVSSVQIKIVILNLLRNGLEASLACKDTDSHLCVSVSAKEGSARVTINDSGAGIPAETKEQLFQPFETSKSTGLGLGLIISRCLATVHGGHIECQPGIPHGTAFLLHLPLAQGNPR